MRSRLKRYRIENLAWPIRLRTWVAPAGLGLLLSLGLLVLSGCTAQDFVIKTPTPSAANSTANRAATPEATKSTAPAPSQTAAGANRLLVISEEGNLFTVNPEGGERLDLTKDAGLTLTYLQPTWSPTGDQIGWTQIEKKADETISTLITSHADGSARQSFKVPFPPFYLNWSPDGAQLAYLSNWVDAAQQTIALRLVKVATGDAEIATLGTGQPLYFSWSPDSKQLLTHVDNQRTALLGLDGTEKVIADQSANFATPQWAVANGKLLYEQEKDGQPQLVIADASTAVTQVVTYVKTETMLNFSLSPKGDQVAYTETDNQVGLNSLGPLFVFDLAKNEFQQLTTDPVVAFFWSPDSHALLFMTPEIEGRQLWLQLQVWDGQTTRKLSRFMPSALFVQQYLPFADQYAQSIRVWSPDSQAVVFAGQTEDEKTSVWVQAIDGKSAAKHITDGLFATWSPR